MEWLKVHWFKVGILVILLLIVGLLAYYFMGFVPANEAAQQQAVLQAQQAQQQAATDQANLVAGEKAACVTEAQQNAISLYENSPTCSGDYGTPAKDCTDGSTYLTTQYNAAYTTCLESKGLQ